MWLLCDVRKRPKSERTRQNEELVKQIRQTYEDTWRSYGSPRIHAELRDQGISCSRKRVARLMREASISAQPKRRRVHTTDSRHSTPVADNRLNREFSATEMNTKWASDITGIETAQGWLYLAVILDLYSRKVIGWSMSAQRDETLVENALLMALSSRRPAAGLLLHSDRGSQYTSHRYQELLKQYEIEASMSRKGNCWDNAVVESFFGTLKTECPSPYRYESQAVARSALFEYIETFYNRKRRHSSLGYLSPLAFEQQTRKESETHV